MALSETPGSRGSPMLVGYSCVHVGKSLLWAGEDALTLYIMVRFLALPPALAGAIFLASALWNALCDGVIGAALQRSAWLRRWIALLSIPAILASALGFAALPLLAPHSIWEAAVLLLMFRTGFSVADVPHNGLTRLLAKDGQHLRAARIRAIGSGTAALVIGLACLVMLTGGGNVGMLVGWIALVALVLMTPLPFMLAAQRDTDDFPSKNTHSRFGNRALWSFCAATMVGLVGLGAMGKAVLHLNFLAVGIGPAAMLLATVGRLGAIWVWSPAAERLGNRTALGLAYGLSGVTALLLPWLAAAEGIGIAILLTLFGMAGGGIALLGWAVLTETIEREQDRGTTSFTAACGIFTMGIKVALGVAAMLVGVWLSTNSGSVNASPAQFWSLGVPVALACMLAGGSIALTGTGWLPTFRAIATLPDRTARLTRPSQPTPPAPSS